MAPKKKAVAKKKGMTTLEAVEIGAGVLAAVAAAGATGYYFYGTKNAKKHRHAASVWAKGMKKDVEKEVRALKKVDAATVAKAVEKAAKAYQGMKGVADSDIAMAAKELKANWKVMKAEMEPSAAVKKAVAGATKKGAASKVVKKAVKTAKKTVKKATKK